MDLEIWLQFFTTDVLHPVVHPPVAAAAEDAAPVDTHHEERIRCIRE